MSFYRYIEKLNPKIDEPLIPWIVDDLTVGWIRPSFAEHLRAFPSTLLVEDHRVVLHPEVQGFEARTDAMQEVNQSLVDAGTIPPLFEPYPVTPAGRDSALFTIDRASAAFYGIRSFGQHLNGYVRDGDDYKLWIARRAKDRLIFPGALDNMVAGGLPHGLGMTENLIKECYEEAAVPEELARKARPVGTVSYNRMSDRGFRPDVLYCYDLELPADFVPVNTDGEVEEFTLLPLQEVMSIVRDTDEFKLNCNLVLIDFFIRHGAIAPDSPEYLELVNGLRRPMMAPYEV